MRLYVLPIFWTIMSLYSQSVWSQSQDIRDTSELVRLYEKEGQLFTVKIVPKSKSIDVFVVGYKSAGIKFTDLGLEAFAMLGDKKINLSVEKGKNSFHVDKTVSEPFTLDLKLKQKNDKTDTLRFDVK